MAARGLIEFDSYHFPNLTEDIVEAFENYLISGWNPGGFGTAMLAGDLFRAASVADVHNRTAIADVAKWIMHCAPQGSWGSYEIVERWMSDVDNVRTIYATAQEKKFIWKTLKTPSEMI
jgi:hypothetical protein